MITFKIPYFESFFQGKGEVIAKHESYTTVKVIQGFLAGHTTDISNLYIIK